ncbi:MAG: HlyD family efflux transporter periplasmic adaptor subunit [Acidobacteria bacterium]|nr:HlyD family efflux transporter periplasmic adaptor subunit [Acidobacteriota bacterium]
MRTLFRPRVLLTILIVGALVALALWPETMAVTTATVTRGPLTVTIDEDGRTRVRDRFVVTAPVAGEVMRITLEPGDRVERGRTLLATIRPAAPVPLDARTRAELEASLRAGEAALGRISAEERRARTALTLIDQQVRRTEALAGAGALARETLEVQQAEQRAAVDAVRAAEFAVAQARQEVEAIRARLGAAPGASPGRTSSIVAPVDGVVLVRHVESQRVVAPGEPLIELGDAGAIEIVADLLSVDAVRVRPGTRVLIDQWGGDTVLEGRVRRVEPSGFTKISALGVEEQRVNVIIDVGNVPEEAGRLGDGFRVEVRIVMWEEPSVLQVPASTLFRSGADWAVYVVADERAVLRRVTLGQRGARDAQVIDGVTEGEVLVAYPPDTLTDGARVRVGAD